jgi:hypothetical protein
MATERTTGGAGRARSDAPSVTPDQWEDPASTTGTTGTTGSTGATRTAGNVGNTGSAETAGTAGAEVASSARGLMDSAREGARRRLDTQKDRAVSGLSSLVETLRESGRQLKNQDTGMASFTDGAANQLDRLVDGLRRQDLGRMASDLERFARRRPAVFVGGAFLVGLAAARFLKSSADAGSSDQEWRSSSTLMTATTPSSTLTTPRSTLTTSTPAVSSQPPRGSTYGQSGGTYGQNG